MEHAQDKFKADLILLERALATLAQALHQPLTDIVRDATIQRFEYVFELSWKTIGAASSYMGTVCRSPREAVKNAFKSGWIKDATPWLVAMDARNRTSHTYSTGVAAEVYGVAKIFPPLVEELIESLKKL